MKYIDVTVEVELDEFADVELIDELEQRGYNVVDQAEEMHGLTEEEQDWICDTIIGLDLDRESVTRSILDKLSKK